MSEEFLKALGDLGLEHDLGAAPKNAKPALTFPCMRCAGTGVFRGYRVHNPDTECYACKGVGSFKTDPRKRQAANAKRKDTLARNLAAKKQAFREQNPGVIEFLNGAAENSEFCLSLLTQFRERGALSENQVRAARSTQLKFAERAEQRKAERAAEAAARTVTVDLGKIREMFDHARDKGLKHLAYRANGLVISPAKASGRNPGALYVKRRSDGEYLGKVFGDRFECTREATESDKATLNELARNPKEAAESYGKRTGECACCGRELTDPESIERGIGPICAEKWFGA